MKEEKGKAEGGRMKEEKEHPSDSAFSLQPSAFRPYYLVSAGHYGAGGDEETYSLWRWHDHDLAAALGTMLEAQQEDYDFVTLTADWVL